MKILITGASGLLGPYLREAFTGSVHSVSTTSGRGCDLTNRASVHALLRGHKPDVVVHAAAMTDVDECERDPTKALEVNRDTAYHIAEQLDPKAKLVYISTDMVYGGTLGPHREIDACPVNMYGRSKFAGEVAAHVNPRRLVVRTNFFGPALEGTRAGRKSFSDWVLESLQDGSTPIFFNDVWWSPLHAKTLSALVCRFVERDVVGIYNVGASNGLSKAAFAMLVAEQKGLLENFKDKCVGPSHFHTKRPRDMTMDCSKIELGGPGWLGAFRMPTLEEEIRKL